MSSTVEFEFPIDFDPRIYQSKNPDLKGMSENDLASHYRSFGREEGRQASLVFDRAAFGKIVPSEASALEIGPFDTPFRCDASVDYADVLSSDQLRARAVDIEDRNPAFVPKIKWVCPEGNLKPVLEKYDVVISSHLIEHQVDLIGHLNEVKDKLLSGGRYFLVVPDKRYCFDHHLPETDISEIIEMSLSGMKLHTTRSVIRHFLLNAHNDPIMHWKGNHGVVPAIDQNRLFECMALIKESERKGEYLDVHSCQFTPDSFARIIDQLYELQLISCKVDRMYATCKWGNEFYAVLSFPEVFSD
jgi:hypothetical protein